MGHGQLRKVSTISKRISSTTNFHTNSAESLSAIGPNENVNGRPTAPDVNALKRRRSSARRSIYSIEADFGLDATDDGKPIPPDGGYGWVIVMAVHFIQAMGMGFLTSLGIFYIEWRKYFESTAAETSLVISLSSVVIGVISPMSARIAALVGPRPLVMTGAVVVFIGLLATSFATSITQLTLTIGVLTAFGYGLICSPGILVIADYFDNNYALANGIAFSGVSFGQLVFPPLCVEFIYWFGGWRSAMFVFSALLLNIAVFGALLRPINKVKPNRHSDTKQIKSTPTTYQNAGFEEDLNYLDPIPSSTCVRHIDNEITPLEALNELPILNMIVRNEAEAVSYLEDSNKKQQDSRNCRLKKYKEKLGYIMKNVITFMAKSYGIPAVFQSPLFVMMIPSVICIGIGMYATITHQAARAISVGISEEDASLLLSLMGIGSLVGRATHGWFIDRGVISSEMCLVFSLGVCSVSTYLICFVNLFPVLAILATIQGLTSGVASTLCVVIIKTFAKPNFEDTAVGMLFLVWGFGDLIGGVVAGYLYDSTGDYNVSFYFAGSALAFATILVYLTCALKDRIVTKLYRKLALRQLEKVRNNSDQLNDLNRGVEEYDNEVFKIENEEELKDKSNTSSCVTEQRTMNIRPIFQIEIHDSWERASSLQDTNV